MSMHPIAAYFWRMAVYVFFITALGIIAHKLNRLSGNETYVLDGLLALTIAAIAEYRVAQAQSESGQPQGSAKPLKAPKPAAPPRYTSTPAPRQSTSSPAPPPRPAVPKRGEFNFPTALLVRILGWGLLILAALYVAGLIFYWRW